MAPPSASATRRTRWIQGSIIGVSAVIIIVATVHIAGRSTRPRDQTTPVVTTTHLVITSTLVVEPTAAAVIEQPAPAEQPVPLVAPATVEAPPVTTAAAPPVIVTYANCAAVWAALGGPIQRGEPGYDETLDGNRDGVGCEQRPG